MKMSREHYENNNERVNHSTRRTTYLNATVSNTNPTRMARNWTQASAGGGTS